MSPFEALAAICFPHLMPTNANTKKKRILGMSPGLGGVLYIFRGNWNSASV